MKRLIPILLIAPLVACSALQTTTDPVTGETKVVNVETGEEVPVVDTVTNVANAVGGIIGIPGLGIGLGAIAAGLLAKRAKGTS